MPTVTGTLEAILDAEAEPGVVEVQLCGYGSQVPRYNGQSLIARLTADEIEIEADGTFTFTVPGNDQISPDGTYYAVTIMNANRDIAQVNAYRFLADGTSYDLNLLEPYDPNQPPPPLPPLITNLLLVVPWSAEMDFPGDIYTSYRVNLTGDVTSSTASGTVQGNLYTYIIQQDSVGNRAFPWPEDFLNPSPINPAPNGFTVQTFVMGVTHLIPIGAAIWFDQ
jgi:hypothetical protein